MKTVGVVVSDFDIRISNFSTFGTPKVEFVTRWGLRTLASKTQMHDDFDSPWKDILDCFFEDMMALLFPQIACLIDWSRGYEPLDKEFQKIVFDGDTGRVYADKLYRVYKRDGTETLLLIHIEIQGQKDGCFPERMFIYNYRAYDCFRLPVISLAILVDSDKNWRPDRFSYGEDGARMELRFPVVKIVDFADQWEVLEQSENVFSLCIMAQLKAMQTKNDYEQRGRWKFYLLRFMVRKGYNRQQIIELLRFIDWVLMLPDKMNEQIWQDFTQLEEVKRMPYISSFERYLLEKGFQEGKREGKLEGKLEGKREGKLEGKLEGKREGKQEDILEILALKNNVVPEEIQQKVRQITDMSTLQSLLRVAIFKQSLNEFQQELNKFYNN